MFDRNFEITRLTFIEQLLSCGKFCKIIAFPLIFVLHGNKLEQLLIRFGKTAKLWWQQRPIGSSEPIGFGLISHFCTPQPDTSWRCEFPGTGLVKRGNVSVVAAAQLLIFAYPLRDGRLSRPRATVCKFPAHSNYVVTQSVCYGIRTRGRPITNPAH